MLSKPPLTTEPSAVFLVHSRERSRGAQPTLGLCLDRAVAPGATQASPVWVRCPGGHGGELEVTSTGAPEAASLQDCGAGMPTVGGPRDLEAHVTRQYSQHIVEVHSMPVGPFLCLIKASEL